VSCETRIVVSVDATDELRGRTMCLFWSRTSIGRMKRGNEETDSALKAAENNKDSVVDSQSRDL
jgi:hypothetical protein